VGASAAREGASKPIEAPEPEVADQGPSVPPAVEMPEFTVGPVVVGALLGILFGASSIYLVLKAGVTVSASILVAVLSIMIFRGLAKLLRTRRATILENNIVQTTGRLGPRCGLEDVLDSEAPLPRWHGRPRRRFGRAAGASRPAA